MAVFHDGKTSLAMSAHCYGIEGKLSAFGKSALVAQGDGPQTHARDQRE